MKKEASAALAVQAALLPPFLEAAVKKGRTS